MLCLTNNLGIEISYIGRNKKEYRIEGGTYPILWILGNNYRKNISSLKKKNLLYVNQLLYNDQSYIKE